MPQCFSMDPIERKETFFSRCCCWLFEIFQFDWKNIFILYPKIMYRKLNRGNDNSRIAGCAFLCDIKFHQFFFRLVTLMQVLSDKRSRIHIAF